MVAGCLVPTAIRLLYKKNHEKSIKIIFTRIFHYINIFFYDGFSVMFKNIGK